ncbi:MAG: TrkH family potassium uptake protein [Opitutales bacterium]|nr:TrkH family potassium uptake protein [Opitutales bacterium]NRA25774.1 TrkH family potassium uptake protein [Opitutales bacterium]
MNYRLISRLLGYTTFALTAALIVSALCGIVYWGDVETELDALIGFAWAIGISLFLGIALVVAGRGADDRFFRKEAFALIGNSWLIASVLGAVPYLMVLPGVSVSDAFFESVSGLTTTGASVFTGFETWPRSLLFWRCMSQWIGGLGVVVFFVAILSSLGAGAKMLFTNESSGTSSEVESSRIQSGAMNILKLYLLLTLTCWSLLMLAGLDWYEGLCHAFTTIATGGFSTRSDSIAAFANPAVEWTMVVFMLIGGTSFLWMLKILRGHWRQASRNSEVRSYYMIFVLATALIAIELAEGGHASSLKEGLRLASFQVASLMTSSGFASADYDDWIMPAKIVLLSVMIIGGCSGSTAGGYKVIRIVVTVKVAILNLQRSIRPHLVRQLRIHQQPLKESVQFGVISYTVVLLLSTAASIFLLSVFEHNLSFETTITAAIACLFNVGPGFDQVGPTSSYADMLPITKVFLSILMIMGRLELYAILALLSPSLWRRFS